MKTRTRYMLLIAATFAFFGTSAFAAVPTYTGCYSASSGTINKLAVGWSPQKPCNTGDIQVSFSAGDITKISVTGGLSGGGDNGDVTISLDSKYSLPQSCAANSVAKWTGTAWLCANDENTTYTNGTGLNLSGANNAFGILPSYQLPQGCGTGNVPTWNAGSWACIAPTPQTHAYAVSASDFVNIPSNTDATIVSLTVPAGKYIIFGSALVFNTSAASLGGDPQNANCRLYIDGTEVEKQDVRLAAEGDPGNEESLSLQAWGSVSQTITMTCGSYSAEAKGKLTAIAVGAIN